jgi:hypothetical protein
MRLRESACGDRKEQEGERLPAYPQVKLKLGQGLAQMVQAVLQSVGV